MDKYYCPKCKSHAFRSGKFCYLCGTELTESPKCESCGEGITIADIYCSNCGEKVITQESQEDLEKREALGLMRQDQENDEHDCGFIPGGEGGCDHPIHKDQPEP